jgi:PKD repeat protein
VSFTNTSYGDEPMSYLWDFGDGSSSTEISPTHTYTNPGWYTAVLTATNALGSDSASQDLGVRPPPQASFYVEDVAFEDTPVVFQNQSLWAQRYLWVFGDGGKSRRPNPVHVFSDPGTYTVRLVARSLCGKDVFQKPIEVVPLP